MVKIVRVPAIAKKLFTANELAGYEDGIKYTPRELKLRKKYRAQNNLKLPVDVEPAKPLKGGKKLS